MIQSPLANDNAIFVFGSNLGGRHGKGNALHARQHYGAIYGQGAGLQGQSYAIPTKDGRLKTLPLDDIAKHVTQFIKFAGMCQFKGLSLVFNVTPIGCGLVGYKPRDIAPLFKDAVKLTNVRLPPEFLGVLNA